jgi:hypothetical protein
MLSICGKMREARAGDGYSAASQKNGAGQERAIRQGTVEPSRNGRSGANLEAELVGKFIFGMVSGGLVVTGGLMVASALFPVQPANDNGSGQMEEPIVAPEAADAEAGPAVAAAAPDAPEAAEDVPAEAIAEDEPAAADAAAEEPATVASGSQEPAPVEAKPEVDGATTAPAAPQVGAEETADPVAPAAAEVAQPETMTAPSKPAEATADMAATAPDAPTGTQIAATEPEPVVPPVEPQPAEAAAEPEATETVPAQTTTETPEPAPAVASETASSALTTEADAAPAEEVVVAEATPEPSVEPASEPVPGATPDAAPEAAPTEETQVAEATPEPEAPAAEAPVAPDAADVTEPMPDAPAPEPVPEPMPDVMPAPETAEADAPAAKSADEPAPDMPGARPDALPGEAESQDPPTATDEKSSTFKPAPGLPRASETGDEAPADPAADPVDPRPIVQFAASFENPDAKPPFAIVLIDDGSAALDRAALAALPFPVSFALNPLDPASAQHAATYRAAGKEVVMLVTGIAEGAMPTDVEVAFQSMEQGLAEAVAVMDLPEPTFQNRRPLAATVVPILKAQGRGLLTWDAGLNAADQVARREDLEAGVIFRDLSSAGGDAAAIRRLLDRAVFKAGQEGRVSVVGMADQATVAAILEWTVEGKAATVALAPVTAVLTVE